MKEGKRSLFGGNLRQMGMVIALVVITIVFGVLTKGTLFRPMNISNIFMQNSFEIILAIGMFFCMLTGGNVDLSVGSVVGLSGAVMAVLTLNYNIPTSVAVVMTLLTGIIVGGVQAGFIAFLKVPPFIATLAGTLVCRGLCQLILGGQTLSPFSEGFQFFANGFVARNVKVGNLNVFCMVVFVLTSAALILSELNKRKNRQKHGFIVSPVSIMTIKLVCIIAVTAFILFSLSAYNGVPFILIVMAALTLIYSFIAGKTTIGRHIYMMGGNPNAAKLSGVRTQWMMFIVYVNSALMATVAGLAVTGRLNAATPKAGTGYELDAIAACTIGGVAGATGSVMGAVLGACVMAILNNGMSILGLGTDLQQVIKGCILLLAVTFDIYLKNKAKNN